MEENYNSNQYYKTFNHKFNLPNIIQAGKVIYKEGDTTVFFRTFKEDHEFFKTKSSYENKKEISQDSKSRNHLNSRSSSTNGMHLINKVFP